MGRREEEAGGRFYTILAETSRTRGIAEGWVGLALLMRFVH